MFKSVAFATLGLSLAICVGNAFAVEMSMPTGDFAHGGGGGAGEAGITTATARSVGAPGALREPASHGDDADSATSVRDRMQPDSTTVTRSDSTHAAVGADTAPSLPATALRKARHNAHWQSLLPGVMK